MIEIMASGYFSKIEVPIGSSKKEITPQPIWKGLVIIIFQSLKQVTRLEKFNFCGVKLQNMA